MQASQRCSHMLYPFSTHCYSAHPYVVLWIATSLKPPQQCENSYRHWQYPYHTVMKGRYFCLSLTMWKFTPFLHFYFTQAEFKAESFSSVSVFASPVDAVFIRRRTSESHHNDNWHISKLLHIDDDHLQHWRVSRPQITQPLGLHGLQPMHSS